MAAALQNNCIRAPKLGGRTSLTAVFRVPPAGLRRARNFSAAAPPVRLGGVAQGHTCWTYSVSERLEFKGEAIDTTIFLGKRVEGRAFDVKAPTRGLHPRTRGGDDASLAENPARRDVVGTRRSFRPRHRRLRCRSADSADKSRGGNGWLPRARCRCDDGGDFADGGDLSLGSGPQFRTALPISVEDGHGG